MMSACARVGTAQEPTGRGRQPSRHAVCFDQSVALAAERSNFAPRDIECPAGVSAPVDGI